MFAITEENTRKIQSPSNLSDSDFMQWLLAERSEKEIHLI